MKMYVYNSVRFGRIPKRHISIERTKFGKLVNEKRQNVKTKLKKFRGR